ncbi:endonuclease domain-containing protein [Nonlabens antarcticus]|uniref:endonuclease domain-containing protein n=1 Tax=Nonlabens antarcticus TaxID=392714 RepID=UPI001E47F3F2|nr:endonuclease domain-containing protein [Nonlabens antarcticus]
MEDDDLKRTGMHSRASPTIFRNAEKLRVSMTPAEVILWDYVKTKPLSFKFRRQHPIAGYILDFYCHRIRLSIEIDGGYHLTQERNVKDKVRTAYLQDLGISEIRFKNSEITDDLERVVERINSILRDNLP